MSVAATCALSDALAYNLHAQRESPLLGIFSYHYRGIPGWTKVSELNDSATHSNRHRLRAIARTQFFHDVLDVDLHRFFGDK